MSHVTQQLPAHFIRVMQRGPAVCARKRSMDQSVTEDLERMRGSPLAIKPPNLFNVMVRPNAYGRVCAMIIVFFLISFKLV